MRRELRPHLEQVYRPGLLFNPQPPPKHAFELKMCQLCGNWYTRPVEQRRQEQELQQPKAAEARYRLQTCAACRTVRDPEERALVNRRDLEVQEKILKERKEEVQRWRRQGAFHPVNGRQAKRRAWDEWRLPIYEAFARHGTLTSRELGDLLGNHNTWVVPYLKTMGIPIITVGYEYRGGRPGRGLARYGLDIDPKLLARLVSADNLQDLSRRIAES